jgi:hypothetical protein
MVGPDGDVRNTVGVGVIVGVGVEVRIALVDTSTKSFAEETM